jgi:hypothetical protein
MLVKDFCTRTAVFDLGNCDYMSESKRRIWRIHLSTAIVLMLLAGALLGLNLFHVRHSPFEPEPGGRLYYHAGWPFSTDYFSYKGWGPRPGIQLRELLYNIAFSVATMALVAFVMEFLIRRSPFRMSLRTIGLLTLTSGASVWLYANKCPWQPELKFKGSLIYYGGWGPLSFDRSRLALSSGDDVTILETRTFSSVGVLKDAGRPVEFSADARRLLTQRWNETNGVWDARLWDSETGNLVVTTISSHARLSVDGGRLLMCDDKAATLRVGPNWERQIALPQHNAPLSDIRFSRDGSRLLTCADDGRVFICDSNTGAEVCAIQYEPTAKGNVALKQCGVFKRWQPHLRCRP